jgi:hypothetical protein
MLPPARSHSLFEIHAHSSTHIPRKIVCGCRLISRGIHQEPFKSALHQTKLISRRYIEFGIVPPMQAAAAAVQATWCLGERPNDSSWPGLESATPEPTNQRLLTFAISSAGARHNFSIQDTFQISPSHPLSYFFLASDVVIFCTLLKVILRAQTDTRNINLCLMERKMKKKSGTFHLSFCLPLMLDRRRGSYRLRKKLPRYRDRGRK